MKIKTMTVMVAAGELITRLPSTTVDCVWNTPPITNIAIACTNAPEINVGLRPQRSIQMTAGIVARKLQIPVAPVATSELVVPDKPAD